MIYVLIIVGIILLLALWYRESFVDKQEKSRAMLSWFQREGRVPTFTEYKRDMPLSDIVEYEKALALYQQNKMTQGTIIASFNTE